MSKLLFYDIQSSINTMASLPIVLHLSLHCPPPQTAFCSGEASQASARHQTQWGCWDLAVVLMFGIHSSVGSSALSAAGRSHLVWVPGLARSPSATVCWEAGSYQRTQEIADLQSTPAFSSSPMSRLSHPLLQRVSTR